MTLTVAEVREYVGTSLSNEAVQRMLDAAYAAITDQAGPPGDRTEQRRTHGPLLMLGTRAAGITGVTEDLRGEALVLSSTDFALRSSGRLLERLDTGANPRTSWAGLVQVVYAPALTEADRDRVAIELVRYEATYSPALASQSSDSWSESYHPPGASWDYAQGRAAILATLSERVVVL